MSEPTPEQLGYLMFVAWLYSEYLHWCLRHPEGRYISPHDWVAAFF